MFLATPSAPGLSGIGGFWPDRSMESVAMTDDLCRESVVDFGGESDDEVR